MPSQPVVGHASPAYLRTALSPRMLVLLVLLLTAAAVCGWLGAWQLDRAQLSGRVSAEERAATLEAAPALPLADVLAPQSSFPGDLVGQKVVARGTFEDGELLVTGRTLDGRAGVLVLSPLRVTGGVAGADVDEDVEDGADGGPDGPAPVLAVVRGWVPDVRAAEALAPAPSGEVEVTGYLQAGEGAGESGLPAGQVDAISPAELVNRWGGPTYSAYLVATATDPPQDAALAPLPPPTASGGGLNVQNVAYALQWWIFAGFAVLLWVRMVRDEARALAEEPAADTAADTAADRDGPAGPGTPAASPQDVTGSASNGHHPADLTRRRTAAGVDASP